MTSPVVPRRCEWPGCAESIGLNASPRRHYCAAHRSEARRTSKIKQGGRWLGTTGYAWIRLPNGRAAPEHRFVMEQMIGRPMRPGESVHHKNGVRDDNRPDNLELWIGPIRAGVRAVDIRCPHCEKSYWPLPTVHSESVAPGKGPRPGAA